MGVQIYIGLRYFEGEFLMAEYLTTEEALKILRVARSTLYEWIGQGKVKTYKVAGGRKNYFKQSELEALFQPRETAQSEDQGTGGQ